MNIQKQRSEKVKEPQILGHRTREYRELKKQLHGLALLAQGNVFAFEPSAAAPRARTHYTWTRKVKNKTVTKALSEAQYEVLKQAIEANQEVERVLGRLRELSQDAILKSLPDSPGKRKGK